MLAMVGSRGPKSLPDAEWARTAPERERRRVLGQNFFRSAAEAARFAEQVPVDPTAAVVEIGPGAGHITRALVELGHDLDAVEIDPVWADRLRHEGLPRVRVHTADFLEWSPSPELLLVVGNLPFGSSSALLRRCLGIGPERLRGAVLLVQKEVAEKRRGRWGGNKLNAQWWPWYRFTAGAEFPRRAFKPEPATDTRTLLVHPRVPALLPWSERARYQSTVEAVFSSGHLELGRACAAVRGNGAAWRKRAGLPADVRVKDLSVEDWAALHAARASAPADRPPPRSRNRDGRSGRPGRPGGRSARQASGDRDADSTDGPRRGRGKGGRS